MKQVIALAMVLVAVVLVAAMIADHSAADQSDRLAAKDEQLASYRLYSSEIAKSLVDLNIQLRERTNECERLQRENMRLERRAMGLSGENEP